MEVAGCRDVLEKSVFRGIAVAGIAIGALEARCHDTTRAAECSRKGDERGTHDKGAQPITSPRLLTRGLSLC